MKNAMVTVQRHWRAFVARDQYLKMYKGFTRLQATVRARKLTRKYRLLRKRVAALQTRIRGFIARRNAKTLLYSVETIQAVFRMVISIQQAH